MKTEEKSSLIKRIRREQRETKILLRSIPSTVVTLFVVSVVCMNLLANKTLVQTTWIALDGMLGGTWFILLGSTVAFLISAVINNFSNFLIGKAFRKNPDGRAAFITRSYLSTFIGQFLDNLIFSVIVFVIFAPIFWDGFHWTLLQCTTCALTGAVAELIMEALFSPFGYRIVKKWQKSNVGKEYLELYEVKK